VARLGDQVEPQQIGVALHFHVSNVHYRRAQRAGCRGSTLTATGVARFRKATRRARPRLWPSTKLLEALSSSRRSSRCQCLRPQRRSYRHPPGSEPAKRLAGLWDLREAAKHRKAEMA
jgi:hypothetical protein